MKIRRAIAAAAFVSAAGFAAAQQADEPRDERPALEPLEVLDVEAPPTVTDVTYFNGRWAGANFTLDRLEFFDFRGNVLGTYPLNLGVFNLYSSAGNKLYFDAVDSSSKFRGGYLSKDFMVNGMFLPSGFVPGGVAVHPDDTGVFISKSPPSLVWFTKDYVYSSPPITIPGLPSKIDICPGGNWCIGTQTGLLVLDRNWSINAVPNFTVNVTALRFCGDRLFLGGNGFVNYSLNPGVDYRSWQFKGFTVPFQVNSFDCGQNGTAVGAGSNGGAVYVDPTNNVTRTFQLSPTRTFVKVSLGPGRLPNGYFQDSQGGLLFSIPASDIQWPADRNTSSSRLISLSLRHLF